MSEPLDLEPIKARRDQFLSPQTRADYDALIAEIERLRAVIYLFDEEAGW